MEEKQTKICPYCKKKILIKAKKCKYCGNWLTAENSQQQKEYVQTKLNIEQPSCSNTLQANSELTKACPYCCQKIPLDAKKCQFCGEWVKEKSDKGNKVYGCFNIIAGTIIVVISAILEVGSNGNGIGFVTVLFACIALAIYFLPTTIADNKRNKNTTSIFIVNLFFGYTIIGWVIALVWALTDEH